MPKKKKSPYEDFPLERALLYNDGQYCPNCVPVNSWFKGYRCRFIVDFSYSSGPRWEPKSFKKQCTLEHWGLCPFNPEMISNKGD